VSKSSIIQTSVVPISLITWNPAWGMKNTQPMKYSGVLALFLRRSI
jgi:hypothetical protein